MSTFPLLKRKRSVAALALLAISLAPIHGGVAAETTKSPAEQVSARQKLIAAQRRLDEAAREVADLSMSLSENALPQILPSIAGMHQGAFLGVGLSFDDERDDGVTVLSVSPGGAAATAGLQAGDVLTELNGKTLKRDGDESPRTRLFAVMRDVKPGDKVAVRFKRDNKVQSVTVVAQAPADRMFVFGGGPGRFATFPGLPFMRSEGVFGSAEMVALTPKLGRYFGTEKGLLVVRAPADDRLKLEEGDVIVDIDGRVPESAAHASRILGSYEAGEKLRLNVLRMKQKVTLDVEVPAAPAGRKFEQRIERSGFGTPPFGPGVMMPETIPLPPPGPGPDEVRRGIAL